MLNESSAVPADQDAAATPVEPAKDEPKSPMTLLVLARDDDLVCVDETCAPVEPAR
jgi:hypothetical protein